MPSFEGVNCESRLLTPQQLMSRSLSSSARKRAAKPLTRSEQMSRIRSRDTVPELLLRKAVWALGLRYRVCVRLPGRPDIVFPRQKLVVFVDGCFWHGCPLHYVRPKSNTSYWSPKIEANIARDRRQEAALEEEGWHVLRLWEHEIEADPEGCARRVALTLKQLSA